MIDGEAVIWANGRLNFTALQQRLSAGPKTLPGLVRQTPANYVAFDVLAPYRSVQVGLTLEQRRSGLEEATASIPAELPAMTARRTRGLVTMRLAAPKEPRVGPTATLYVLPRRVLVSVSAATERLA